MTVNDKLKTIDNKIEQMKLNATDTNKTAKILT